MPFYRHLMRIAYTPMHTTPPCPRSGTVRPHPKMKGMKVGHAAAACSLCPNGTGFEPGTVQRGTNPTYKHFTEKGFKLLGLGDTWAAKNAHVVA